MGTCKVIVTLEDLPDGNVSVKIEADPPAGSDNDAAANRLTSIQHMQRELMFGVIPDGIAEMGQQESRTDVYTQDNEDD